MTHSFVRLILCLVFIGACFGAASAQKPFDGADRDVPAFLPPSAIITGGIADNPDNSVPPTEQSEPAQTEPAEPVAEPPPELPTKPLSADAPAPVTSIADITSELDALSDGLGKLEDTVASQQRDDDFLSRTRVKADEAIAKAGEIKTLLEPRLADVESQIEKLGPKPKEGEPPLTEQLKEEWSRVDTAKAEITGAIKTADVLIERSKQLASQTQTLRQRLFLDAVLANRASPLSPRLWSAVLHELPSGGRHLAALFGQWGAFVAQGWPSALALLLVAIAAFEALRRMMANLRASMLARSPDQPPETFFRRAMMASWVLVSFALPGIVAACTLYFGFDAFGLMPFQISRLASVVLLGIVITILVWALSRAILQPRRPAWRLFDVTNSAAKRLTLIFTLMAGVYGADLVLQQLMQTLFLPLPVRVAEAAVVTLASAALVFAFVRTPLVPVAVPSADPTLDAPAEPQEIAHAARPPNIMAPRWLKWPALLLSIAMTMAALTGYVALGRFVASQVIVAGCLVVAGLLLWFAIRAFTNQSGELSERPLENTLKTYGRLEDAQASLLTKATAFLLQAVLPFAAVPLLFWSWGYSFADALGWLKSVFFGFQVGQFRISLVQLLIAAGIFVGLLFLTRLLQRALSNRVMQPGRLDHGVAHSIHTGIGYAGFVIAALAAVSYAGFDITNLAIVAGALSIGIGFGLQSIVNNFVSGLIILFERPIKVGDWVLVNNLEGHVRKISVRATEIETFDRTNVIVPNSDFITNPIINLTHRNALGRVVIPVGVSYQSDPEFVRKLLLQAAEDCPVILDNPSPSVAFDDFGASSLDFSVRGYIADVNNRLSAATQLRLQIFKALQDAGIEIPFPQHDLHLRDLDPVRTMLKRMAEEKAMQAARASGSKMPKTPETSS